MSEQRPSTPPTVWWSDVSSLTDGQLDALDAELDDATRARARRFRRRADRVRTTAAHALVRRLVGRLLDVRPGDVPITLRCAGCGSTDHGKPEVDRLRLPGAPSISIAHAGDLVTVALGDDPLGVDVETVRDLATWQAVRRSFPADEWADAEATPTPARTLARGWARREAVLKATGHGLAITPIRVGLESAAPGQAWGRAPIAPGDPDAGVVSRWWADVELPVAGYVCALASAGGAVPPAPVAQRATL